MRQFHARKRGRYRTFLWKEFVDLFATLLGASVAVLSIDAVRRVDVFQKVKEYFWPAVIIVGVLVSIVLLEILLLDYFMNKHAMRATSIRATLQSVVSDALEHSILNPGKK